MDINELESFKLSDAVKFNSKLNPRLWTQERLRTDVRERLLTIADDFREFLGVHDLDIKDITISGSNAAYTYTPHSDIDLHLVVDLDKVCNNEVYRELFDAKKYQYNDQHNFKIGGYDVELYVQNAADTHHSQGIYSVLRDDWVKVPSRRLPKVDDISVKSKYEDIAARVDDAIASGDLERMDAMRKKIRTMRQAGLDSTGEFGAENLAFKVLRGNGTLQRLSDARALAKDQALSLTERKKKSRTRYGYGTYFYPGYSFFSSDSAEGDGGGGESVTEDKDIKEILQPFVNSCVDYLGIEKTPKIILKRDPEWTRRNGTFGQFDTATRSITLAVSGRHTLDILRTLAHELTHARQDELATMPVDAGKTGSPYEDEANAMAGRIMRHWVDQYPEFFKNMPVEESVKNRLAAVATAACIAGAPGCATTGDAIRGVQAAGTAAQTIKHMGRAGAEEEMMQRLRNELRRRQGHVMPENVTDEDYDPNGKPPGPEFKPTMPAGTVKVDVSDVYDWYKLGQHISDLEGLGQHDFGSGPPSTIMAFGSEEEEHKYINALKKTGLTTTDIDPVDVNQPKDMPRQKTDPTYNVSEAVTDNYLYHATMPAGMMRMLRTGVIKATDRPQASTKAKTQYPTISTTRSKQYAESNEFVDFLNLTNDGNAVILVFDRNSVANHYKMFSTSQGTQTVGDEYEEVIVAPKGSMPIKGTLKGFYFNPKRTAEIQEYQDVPWFRELLNSPYYMGPKQDVNEAFDKPYKLLRWERGDYGDVDAIARLDDNTFLSIMFTKGFSQETKEEAWSVEFYRNNSQEVTGEGDAQRVFATVLSAIQTFIKKYKPNKVYFSASKEVEPGQNAQSRARLYDSLVQRYARAWGFTSSRSDTGNKVMYELSRLKQEVAEAQEQCPKCGGPMFSELLINEKQDACYYKVKSRYKVWPSAYASGALVQCRKKGAANWGNKK